MAKRPVKIRSVGGPAPSSRWFTFTHLQEYLNRGDREALRKAIRREEIHMAKFGDEYVIKDDDFLEWIDRQKKLQGSADSDSPNSEAA